MSNKNHTSDNIEENSEDYFGTDTAVFVCRECGEVDQDNVIFNCNTCPSEELIYKEGIYICPDCLQPGENFECLICGGKKVSLTFSAK